MGLAYGILGEGYIGRHLITYIRSILCEDDHLFIFNRKNINMVNEYRFDIFFNCIGTTGNFIEKCKETVISNIMEGMGLIESLNTKVYVGLSSTRVYGYKTVDQYFFKERDAVTLISGSTDLIYDGSKLLMESVVTEMGNKRGIKVVFVRLSNVIGGYIESDLNENTLVNRLLLERENSKCSSIDINPQSSRDYVHVSDAVKGIHLAGWRARESGLYNIASGKSFSILKLNNLIGGETSFSDNKIAKFSCIDIEKAKLDLGYIPREEINSADFQLSEV